MHNIQSVLCTFSYTKNLCNMTSTSILSEREPEKYKTAWKNTTLTGWEKDRKKVGQRQIKLFITEGNIQRKKVVGKISSLSKGSICDARSNTILYNKRISYEMLFCWKTL